MSQSDLNAPPLNPLPWIVWALALPIIAVELAIQLNAFGAAGGAGAVRQMAWQYFAFLPPWLHEDLATGRFFQRGWRMVSYVLVNGSLTSTIFSVVMLLALGKMVGEIFRWWAVALVFLAAAAAGALAYAFLVPGTQIALIGTFPAVYGLIGAFTFLIWVRLAATGGSQIRAFTLIGFLLGFQLLFGALFGGTWEWVADLAGFAAGFLLSFVVSPGGWGRVMARLRDR